MLATKGTVSNYHGELERVIGGGHRKYFHLRMGATKNIIHLRGGPLKYFAFYSKEENVNL